MAVSAVILNLTFTCYYFGNLKVTLLFSRDINKGGILNLR